MVESFNRWTIPIPWVVFIVLQTGGGFFWAASLQSKVDQHAIAIGEAKTEIAGAYSKADSAVTAITGITAQMAMVVAAIQQIAINTNRITKLEVEIDGFKTSRSTAPFRPPG